MESSRAFVLSFVTLAASCSAEPQLLDARSLNQNPSKYEGKSVITAGAKMPGSVLKASPDPTRYSFQVIVPDKCGNFANEPEATVAVFFSGILPSGFDQVDQLFISGTMEHGNLMADTISTTFPEIHLPPECFETY